MLVGNRVGIGLIRISSSSFTVPLQEQTMHPHGRGRGLVTLGFIQDGGSDPFKPATAHTSHQFNFISIACIGQYNYNIRVKQPGSTLE